MRAGQLDKLITIEQPPTGLNALNEATGSWTALAENVPAEVRDPRGREFFAGAQVAAEGQRVFIIRYRADMDPTLNPSPAPEACRILYGSRRYNIVHVGELGRRQGLEIMATTINGKAP